MENFEYFALGYLNDWYQFDRVFVENLNPGNSRDVRLRCIQAAAKHYGVARNFKTLPDEERLDNALRALDATGDSITDDNVDSTVRGLAKTFQSTYGKNAVSAASKFLWIRHQAPVVIFDSLAFQWLNKGSDGKLSQGDYPTYRREWLKQFAMREDCIRSATAKLVPLKVFSLAHAMPNDALKCLVENRWFAARVFDRFLWWNADNQAVL